MGGAGRPHRCIINVATYNAVPIAVHSFRWYDDEIIEYVNVIGYDSAL